MRKRNSKGQFIASGEQTDSEPMIFEKKNIQINLPDMRSLTKWLVIALLFAPWLIILNGLNLTEKLAEAGKAALGCYCPCKVEGNKCEVLEPKRSSIFG